MPAPDKRYLVHVRFGGDDKARQNAAAQQIGAKVARLSSCRFTLAYTNPTGDTLGLLLRSIHSARTIRGAIDGHGTMPAADLRADPTLATGLLNGDTLFVIEVGEDFSENGYGKVHAWLQHH